MIGVNTISPQNLSSQALDPRPFLAILHDERSVGTEKLYAPGDVPH